MLTIVGSGMTNYSLKEAFEKIKPYYYDVIFMDPHYRDNNENHEIINNVDYKNKIFYGNFSAIKNKILEVLKSNLKINCLYVVTGSPLFYSGSGVVIKYLSDNLPNFNLDNDIKIIDAESSLSYVLAKKGIDSTKVETMSMHGRSKIDIENMFRKKYTFILCDKDSLERISKELKYLPKERYSITVGSRLGYDDEKIFTINDINTYLENNDTEKIHDIMPYVLFLERHFTPSRRITEDDEFLRDRGMITKEFKRSITLSDLELEPNMLMWDVGAGSGSVSIDAYKLYRVKTLMFEKNAKRVEDIKQNLTKHNVIASDVISGDVMETSKGLTEKPDRIFIGGGGSQVAKNIMYFMDKLTDDGIILINYVTLDYIHFVVSTLRENNIKFSVKSLSLTTFKDRNILISEPERLMFQVKIYKNGDKNNDKQ